MGELALGIDVGSTAVKAALVDDTGSVVAYGSAPTRVVTGPGGLVEQEVGGIWAEVVAAARDALSGTPFGPDVGAIALSSQGGTVLLLDEAGHALGNAISWMDTRPARLVPKAVCDHDDAFFYETTGWQLQAQGLPFAQLVRLRREEAERLGRARRIHFIDSYVVERLTGEGVCDPSDAAITMLYNVREQRWDDELLAWAGVTREMLPRLAASGTAVGRIRREAAEELGVSPRATIFAGGHDQYCAAFGAGCRSAGDTVVSCGTAWVALTMTAKPRFDREAGLAPAQAVWGDLWGLLGSCSNVGAAVDWFRRWTSPDGKPIPFETLERSAAAVEPSADGIVFLPPRSGSDGRLAGLGTQQGFGHLARAVLEGVAMSARGLLERMRAARAHPRALKAAGGGARSRRWMQILADVTALPVEIAGMQGTAALGAAVLAGRSAGILSPEAGKPQPSARLLPNAALTGTYDELYRRFRQMGE